MVPLMARVAWEIANKVSNQINVQTIFRGQLSVSKETMQEAKTMLDTWSSAYFQMREKIELSGRDQRWEFDRKRLFEQTNYMSVRIADLIEAVEVLEQFYNIFGP
jgi:dynein heavy chain